MLMMIFLAAGGDVDDERIIKTNKQTTTAAFKAFINLKIEQGNEKWKKERKNEGYKKG